MGISYLFYLEYYHNNEWKLSPLYIKRGDNFEIDPLFEGKSYYSDFVMDFNLECLEYESLSKELQDYYKDEQEEYSYVDFKRIDLNQILKIYQNDIFDHEGYVSKNFIKKISLGCELEIKKPLSVNQYLKLPKEEKLNYQYYKWDDPGSNYCIVKEFAPRFIQVIDYIKEIMYLDNDTIFRVVCSVG